MTETPNLDQLAQQYLDLWQEHLSDLAGNDEMADAIAKSIELMNGSAAAFAKMAESNPSQARDENDGDNTTTASGTAPTGLAPGHSDDVLDQLSRRIGELEQRVAELEGGK